MGTDPGSTRLSVAVEDRVRAAQRGDVAAMDALLTELAPWVGRICAAIALDRGPDAMQETLVLVLRNLPTLREPAALRAWVRRIAVRQSLRMVPDGRVVLVPGLPDSADRPAGLRGGGAGGPGGAGPGGVDTDLDTAIDVRDTLARLQPAQRALLVLRDMEDLSEHETAELLGVPEGTVKSGLHRARRRFRDRWEGS
jgi:RNA polymerase sigma-70 factor (ECF subfamily)